MISDDLKLLFGRDEITVKGTEAIINKWHPRKKAVKIDYTVEILVKHLYFLYICSHE